MYLTAFVIVAVIILLSLSVATMWKKVPQDKALVVTGLKKRVISGGGGFVIPLLERSDRISLENMKISVETRGALTEQGVDIKADGVAVIKVKSDKESILSALEQFNTGKEADTIAVIKDTAKDVLEGKLREIISKLTVEEIYKDREKFASQVQEVAAVDLAEMGLEIKAFTIRDISDDNGYLEALGKKRIAEVKRDADIAEAEAMKETHIKTAEANRLGEEARLIAETQIAEATKEKELKVHQYRQEQETKKAGADLAYDTEASKVQQSVEQEKMQIEIVRKKKEIELAEQESLRRERELQATMKLQADAEKYSQEKQAEAVKFKNIQDAQAKAESIRLLGEANAQAKKIEGEAEVEVIRKKGEAEAQILLKKAEAFKQYNDAAVAQMIIDKLPEIAKSIAEPLSKVEKIVIVDSGSGQGHGAAKVSGYVTDILSTLPETVKGLTGYDLMDLFKKGMSGQTVEGQAVKQEGGLAQETM
ncbi:flotillin [Desulfotomaculum arcticum]|uniref:Flotillin n=1 Tax=Desulfotruncus arcticus DSM 17038 TaxID=1121424 RepID=A0A1I2YWY3_9FIRM|nr:SPFH domain-containing protein [Desulfotruncus arcticus]SFH29779.1 flotillin [Desulfotomaculum arcticum] [Desulfotruncus arcticus DSM 17038]